MTNDTLKSLGFLKKSLSMNYKAMGKNASQDGLDASEAVAFAAHSKAMYDQIVAWENADGSAAVVSIPSGVVQPPPAGPVTLVPDVTAANDLLTID